jgi:hypothetical protein
MDIKSLHNSSFNELYYVVAYSRIGVEGKVVSEMCSLVGTVRDMGLGNRGHRGHRFGRPCFCRPAHYVVFVFPLLCVILNTLFSYTGPQIFPMSVKQSAYERTRATSCKCV